MVRSPYISAGGEGYLAWIGSLVLHVIVGLLVISDISFLSSPPVYVEAPLVVEFVEVADQTTALRPSGHNKPRKMVAPSPNRVQERKPTVKPEKKQKPVTLPSAPKNPPEKRNAPQPLSKAVAEKKKEVPVPKAPQAKKSEKKIPSRVNNDEAFNDLMNDVESLREEITESEVFAEKHERFVEDKSDQERAKVSRSSLSDRPTVSEIDALRGQIERHWVVDPGMKGAEEMAISLKIRLGRDGSVLHIEIMEKERYNRDPAYRAMAESARRAVYRAQPLRYPVEKYDVLETVVLVFRPQTLQSSF